MPKRIPKADVRSFIPIIACDTKRRFKTEKAARDAADQQMLDNMRLTLDVYLCPNCRGWHQTEIKKSPR